MDVSQTAPKCIRRSAVAIAGLVSALVAHSAFATDPWASQVVSYDAGSTGVAGYDQPATALGSPERFSGEGFGFPSVVSPFSPAFGTDEIVSVGEGGHLVVGFDRKIRDDGGNLFGVDFIVFGNGGFVDDDYPNGRTTDPALTFGVKSFVQVSISANGTDFTSLGNMTNGFFPAQGYLDGGPYDSSPGQTPSDFTKPVNPALTLNDFNGKTLAEIRALYDGSGGGTPIDLAGSGLSEIQYVRLDVLDDGNSDTSLHAEIDGFSVVPEPDALCLGLLIVLSCARRRG